MSALVNPTTKKKVEMKIDLVAAITQSLKYYLDREINGAELSRSLVQNFEAADGLDKKQSITFKYYINFFEKEGKELYLGSNRFLKDEVDELSEFLDGLVSD
jgi:hypothetical protein